MLRVNKCYTESRYLDIFCRKNMYRRVPFHATSGSMSKLLSEHGLLHKLKREYCNITFHEPDPVPVLVVIYEKPVPQSSQRQDGLTEVLYRCNALSRNMRLSVLNARTRSTYRAFSRQK